MIPHATPLFHRSVSTISNMNPNLSSGHQINQGTQQLMKGGAMFSAYQPQFKDSHINTSVGNNTPSPGLQLQQNLTAFGFHTETEVPAQVPQQVEPSQSTQSGVNSNSNDGNDRNEGNLTEEQMQQQQQEIEAQMSFEQLERIVDPQTIENFVNTALTKQGEEEQQISGEELACLLQEYLLLCEQKETLREASRELKERLNEVENALKPHVARQEAGIQLHNGKLNARLRKVTAKVDKLAVHRHFARFLIQNLNWSSDDAFLVAQSATDFVWSSCPTTEKWRINRTYHKKGSKADQTFQHKMAIHEELQQFQQQVIASGVTAAAAAAAAVPGDHAPIQQPR